MIGRVGVSLWVALFVSCALAWQGPARAKEANNSASVTFSNLILRIDGDPEVALLEDGYRVHILEHLRKRGYDAVGAENLVFGKDNSDDAEYALGGTVREIECHVARRDPTACRIGVEWQLLHVPTDTVVYKVLTRHAESGIKSLKDRTLGRRLLLGAVERLLAREHFRKTLFATPKPQEAKLPSASIATCQVGDIPLPDDSERALAGTVLVSTGDGFGSGVFLNEDGYVLTAAHVVQGDGIKVRTTAGAEYPATVLRVSEKYDVALLKAGAQGGEFPCLSTDYVPPPAGSDVFVVGAPGGEELAFSISKGIVSGLRTIDDTQFIQTDASVNPGNSGGPMVGANGRVAAVMSFKIAGEAFEGLAFGVPMRVAFQALGLNEGMTTDAALIKPVSVARTAARKLFTDNEDAMPEIDPHAEERRQREAEERREKERDRKLDKLTPGYVKALRVGGYIAAGGGALVGLSTYTIFKASGDMERSEYERFRLQNDIGWGLVGAGAGAVIASYILAPSLAEEAAPVAAKPSTTTLSVVPMGPLGLGVRVSY